MRRTRLCHTLVSDTRDLDRTLAIIAEGSSLGLGNAREAAARLGGSLSLLDRTQRPGLIFRYRQGRKR